MHRSGWSVQEITAVGVPADSQPTPGARPSRGEGRSDWRRAGAPADLENGRQAGRWPSRWPRGPLPGAAQAHRGADGTGPDQGTAGPRRCGRRPVPAGQRHVRVARAETGCLTAATGRVAALVESDHDEAAVLAGRRGHDLRHPLRPERTGLRQPARGAGDAGCVVASSHRSGEIQENAGVVLAWPLPCPGRVARCFLLPQALAVLELRGPALDNLLIITDY